MSTLQIAFLTVISHENGEKIGGLLVLDGRGRPLEFHCTEPVAPNRAQQILYGATLDSYLVGEHIAPALLAKAPAGTRLVLSDATEVLQARHHTNMPIAAVPPPTAAAVSATPESQCFEIGDRVLACCSDFDQDVRETLAIWAEVGRWIDIDEPLERIRAAISEARQAAA